VLGVKSAIRRRRPDGQIAPPTGARCRANKRKANAEGDQYRRPVSADDPLTIADEAIVSGNPLQNISSDDADGADDKLVLCSEKVCAEKPDHTLIYAKAVGDLDGPLAARLANVALSAGAVLTAKNDNTSSEARSFGCTRNAAGTGSRNTRNRVKERKSAK
jgi:hypothetical protein